jgi:hypothetical protein
MPYELTACMQVLALDGTARTAAPRSRTTCGTPVPGGTSPGPAGKVPRPSGADFVHVCLVHSQSPFALLCSAR